VEESPTQAAQFAIRWDLGGGHRGNVRVQSLLERIDVGGGLTLDVGSPSAKGVVVWNTWKAPEEIFLPQAQAPPPWNELGGSLPAE
jgi:hypothetical protein